MWAIYHQWACLFSPHWAIGVGWLSRILIAGSTLKPHQLLEDSGTRRESQIASQSSLRRPFPFQSSSLHPCKACGEGEWEKCMCDGEQSTHTYIFGCWISEWKQEESVTHMAGLRVDYRTPEEIFLSHQTVSGRGLTTAEPQNKHLHCSCNICKETDAQRSSSLHHKNKKRGACRLYLLQMVWML